MSGPMRAMFRPSSDSQWRTKTANHPLWTAKLRPQIDVAPDRTFLRQKRRAATAIHDIKILITMLSEYITKHVFSLKWHSCFGQEGMFIVTGSGDTSVVLHQNEARRGAICCDWLIMGRPDGLASRPIGVRALLTRRAEMWVACVRESSLA